ncbi:MAG TPA: zinc ribbon domain-containing protein [Acidimicrobiales bacterium]|nr:zinc ribbon domain-containing protein [Acidimicrobiales bacterium]
MIEACDVRSGGDGMAIQYRRLLAERRRPICPICRDCGRAQFPPMLICPQCGSSEIDWRDVGGSGSIRTWVPVHTSTTTDGFTIPKWLLADTPYSSVFVQPDALTQDLRLPSLMTGVDPSRLAAGARVVLEVGGDDQHPVVTSRLLDEPTEIEE